MKIVLDTNVLVSAALSPNGPPAAVLRALLTERVQLCFDERIVSEYRDVLTRPKFSFDRDLVDELIGFLESAGLHTLAARSPSTCLTHGIKCSSKSLLPVTRTSWSPGISNTFQRKREQGSVSCHHASFWMLYSQDRQAGKAAAAKRYYERNKQAYLARNKAKKEAIRAWVQSQKNRPCMDCGRSYPHYVMDFDHRDDEEKLYEPTRLYVLQSWKKAKAELAKCDIVCANCHRLRTFGGHRTSRGH